MSTVPNVSNGAAEAELSRCQQMLSVVLFITCLAEKALYYYTLMQCQAATGACSKATAPVWPHTEAVWARSPKPQAGTPHILRRCIKAARFAETQQGPTDQTSGPARAFIQKLFDVCMCVFVRDDEEKHLVRRSLLSSALSRLFRGFGERKQAVPVLTILVRSRE